MISEAPVYLLAGKSIEKKQKPRYGPREGSPTKTPKICQNPEIYENPKTIGENIEKNPKLRYWSREGFAA
jgi:hypothetical protein